MNQPPRPPGRTRQDSAPPAAQGTGKPTLCFGEVLLRFTPQTSASADLTDVKAETGFFSCDQPGERPADSPAARFDTWWGGSEANVAVALALLERPVTLLTNLPRNALGGSAKAALAQRNVPVLLPKERPQDPQISGSRERLGLYFATTRATGKTVHYDRSGSSFALHPPVAQDVDWSRYGHFHTSGINPALSPACHRSTLELLRAARKHNLPTSLDLNLRKQLWSDQQAGASIRELLPTVDLLFAHTGQLASAFDLTPLDLRAPKETAKTLQEFCHQTGLETIIVTNRRSRAEGSQNQPPSDPSSPRSVQLMALYVKGNTTHFLETPWRPASDRSGSGDSFAAGVLAGLSNNPAHWCLEQGLATASLANQTLGDFPTFTHQEVQDRHRLLFRNRVLGTSLGDVSS